MTGFSMYNIISPLESGHLVFYFDILVQYDIILYQPVSKKKKTRMPAGTIDGKGPYILSRFHFNSDSLSSNGFWVPLCT